MMLRLFRHMVRRHGCPDVIYSHYFFSMLQLGSVRRHYPDLPIVGVEHAGRIIRDNVSSPEDIIQYKRAYKMTDRVLAVAPALQEALNNKFNVSADVLYDMVGEEFLVEELVQKTHTPFKFVTTGSLVSEKAIDQIVKAMALVEDRSSELYIIGDGVERGKLVKLSASLDLSDRVHMMGMCNKQQIIELYQQCDAFVLASRLETFCVANIEAMAMGLPVISTRCGGPEYYINESNGILLDVDDFDGLVGAMNAMECDIDKYRAEGLREFVRSHFSGEVIARQAETILQEAIEKKTTINN